MACDSLQSCRSGVCVGRRRRNGIRHARAAGWLNVNRRHVNAIAPSAMPIQTTRLTRKRPSSATTRVLRSSSVHLSIAIMTLAGPMKSKSFAMTSSERLRDRRPHDERDDEDTGDVGGEGATLSKRCRELEPRHDEAVR